MKEPRDLKDLTIHDVQPCEHFTRRVVAYRTAETNGRFAVQDSDMDLPSSFPKVDETHLEQTLKTKRQMKRA